MCLGVLDSCYVVFWNTKTIDEGCQRWLVPRWLRLFLDWLYEWTEKRGRARNDGLFPAGAASVRKGPC